jgi:hypothetical protein
MASCMNAVGEEVVGVVGAVAVAAPEGVNIPIERADIVGLVGLGLDMSL